MGLRLTPWQQRQINKRKLPKAMARVGQRDANKQPKDQERRDKRKLRSQVRKARRHNARHQAYDKALVEHLIP